MDNDFTSVNTRCGIVEIVGLSYDAPGRAKQNARKFFANRKPKKSHDSSYDAATTARVWQVSADLVGLPVDPPH